MQLIGKIGRQSGILTILDAHCIDNCWKSGRSDVGASGLAYVDVYGPSEEATEYLANRSNKFDAHKMGPCHWRILVPDATSRNAITSEIANVAKTREWSIEQKTGNTGASRTVLEDAGRLAPAKVSANGLDAVTSYSARGGGWNVFRADNGDLVIRAV